MRPNGRKYIIIIRSLRNGVMDKESLLNNRKMFVGNTTHNHLIEHIKFSSDTWLSVQLYLPFFLEMKYKDKV